MFAIDFEALAASEEAFAEFAWEHAGDDMREVLDSLSEAIVSYVENHDPDPDRPDTLPPHICGTVCTLLALAWLEFSKQALQAGDTYAFMAAVGEVANNGMHAWQEHEHPAAVAIFGPCAAGDDRLGAIEQRAQDYVLAHLPSSDPDAFLASLTIDPDSAA